jgi:DNA-binding MarR family transcriptional regulator
MHSKLMFPRSIRYLLSVAENHSFTRAAEALHVSQPTLSQQIKLLEEALDAQLLDRSGRTVRLTDAGEVYVRHARRALEELDAAKRAVVDLEDLSRGYLRLGMTPITEYLTTSLVDEFNARYPGIAVNAMEMSQDQIEAGVAEGTLDAGIAFTHATPSEVESSKIEMHTLFMEPLSLAVGADHALAGRQTAHGNRGAFAGTAGDAEPELCPASSLRPVLHGTWNPSADRGGDQLIEHDGAIGAAWSPDHRVADHHRLHAAAPLRRSSVSRTAPPHDCTDRPARDLQEPGLPRLWQACRRVELWPLADFAGSADRTTGQEARIASKAEATAKPRDRGGLTLLAAGRSAPVSGPDQIALYCGHNAAADLDG